MVSKQECDCRFKLKLQAMADSYNMSYLYDIACRELLQVIQQTGVYDNVPTVNNIIRTWRDLGS